MPFYNDLSDYQTLANELKQSKIDRDFVKLYDEIYTSIDTEQYEDATLEYKQLDALIYLLIEAYDQHFFLPDEQDRQDYQDYFAGLLDAQNTQNDAKLTFRSILFETAIFLKLNHYIKTSDHFASDILSAQCPDEDGRAYRHQIMLAAAQYENDALLCDKAFFSDGFLNEQWPGGDDGWTNRHQLLSIALTHENTKIFSNKTIFSDDFLDDFLNAPWFGVYEVWTNRHRLLFTAVNVENNTLFKDKNLFSDEFLNAPWPGATAGWRNRHLLLTEALSHKNNVLLKDKRLFSDDFLNEQWPTGGDDEWVNRHQMIKEALAGENYELLHHLSCFGQTRESASHFLQNLTEQDQKILYLIRSQTLDQKIHDKPGSDDIMAGTLQRIQAILDKKYPEKNEQTDSKRQNLLAMIEQKLKSYTIESDIWCVNLVNESAYYIQGENLSYSAEELQISLEPKGFSPFTRLLVTADDIQYGFASGDLENLLTQCNQEYEESLKQNQTNISDLGIFSLTLPQNDKHNESSQTVEDEKNDADHVKKQSGSI